MTLVSLTRAWMTLREEEVMPETVLENEDENISASSDPVGIINDLHLLCTSLSDHLSSSPEPAANSLREVTMQISEITAVLSTAQLVTRHALSPTDDMEHDVDPDTSSGGGGGGGKRRVSLGKVGGSLGILRELEMDLVGMLGGEGAGAEGVVGWLRGVVENAFGET